MSNEEAGEPPWVPSSYCLSDPHPIHLNLKLSLISSFLEIIADDLLCIHHQTFIEHQPCTKAQARGIKTLMLHPQKLIV